MTLLETSESSSSDADEDGNYDCSGKSKAVCHKSMPVVWITVSSKATTLDSDCHATAVAVTYRVSDRCAAAVIAILYRTLVRVHSASYCISNYWLYRTLSIA